MLSRYTDFLPFKMCLGSGYPPRHSTLNLCLNLILKEVLEGRIFLGYLKGTP